MFKYESKFDTTLIIMVFLSQLLAAVGTITGFVMALTNANNSQIVIISGIIIEAILMVGIISVQMGHTSIHMESLIDHPKVINIEFFGIISNLAIAAILSVILMFAGNGFAQNVGLVGLIATGVFIFEFGMIESGVVEA